MTGQVQRNHLMTSLLQKWHDFVPTPRSVPRAVNQYVGTHCFSPYMLLFFQALSIKGWQGLFRQRHELPPVVSVTVDAWRDGSHLLQHARIDDPGVVAIHLPIQALTGCGWE